MFWLYRNVFLNPTGRWVGKLVCICTDQFWSTRIRYSSKLIKSDRDGLNIRQNHCIIWFVVILREPFLLIYFHFTIVTYHRCLQLLGKTCELLMNIFTRLCLVARLLDCCVVASFSVPPLTLQHGWLEACCETVSKQDSREQPTN